MELEGCLSLFLISNNWKYKDEMKAKQEEQCKYFN